MTAYTYGVYDLFHIGHINLFKRIKENCDKLIVGVHNDEQVMTYKKKPIISYDDRLEIIKSCKYVRAFANLLSFLISSFSFWKRLYISFSEIMNKS